MRIFRRPTREPTEESPHSTDLDSPPQETDDEAILVPKREEFLRDLTKLGKSHETASEPD
jgi:hypothetical protein